MNTRKLLLTVFMVFYCLSIKVYSQDIFLSGKFIDKADYSAIPNVKIYDQTEKLISVSDSKGRFSMGSSSRIIKLAFLRNGYKPLTKRFVLKDSIFLEIEMEATSINLKEVVVSSKETDPFTLKTLKDIEGTSIYAGKKTEVVVLDNTNASLALNNARQIYNRVSGLNIYQNDDAGLQLNIGGRGLDPNRTSNFNTRQNGYDISADVLGYPESYYTPPAEGLERIEIVRGSASLQYGTQFGGLINFVTKKPSKLKGSRYKQRLTTGSNGLVSSFTSIDAAQKKISFYSFFNYKRGNGFRINSDFESKNIFFHVNYDINNKLSSSIEFTGLSYLAQQAGGLNDQMFIEDPLQSNRPRNWFKVNWLLYNYKLNYRPSKNLTHSLNLFALDAERSALGYRSNRVGQADPMFERDLIHGDFNNFGFEYKILSKKKMFKLRNASLLGIKFYESNNKNEQGPGSDGIDANFNFQYEDFPNYTNQSSYNYPNMNFSFFGENVFYIDEKTSITPGFRFEYIDTRSNGSYTKMLFDGANNLIFDTLIYNQDRNTRNFTIFGLGISHKKSKKIELYGNISQNYRSVTFADMSIVNPAFIISPDLEDEKGYTSNFGIKGTYKQSISYNINYFYLSYQQRIGFIQKLQPDGNVKSERRNIGDAQISGIESLFEFNLFDILTQQTKFIFFINAAFIRSQYTSSDQNGIVGNDVEFIPKTNLKTGLNFKFKSLYSNIQLSYVSEQFTDATNAIASNLSGVNGVIPSYKVLDLNLVYKTKKYSIESGINNLLNNSYFTRRASGYPGPGIIPSPRRNYYLTLEINF